MQTFVTHTSTKLYPRKLTEMRYFMFFLRFLLHLLPLLSVYNIQRPLSLPLSNSSTHLCHHEDSISLLQFVRDFVIDSSASSDCADNGQTAYPKIRSWHHNTDCCSWDGVSCDSVSGHVIELDLSCSQIRGTIDSNSTLFQLQRLQSLNLACNYFYNSGISPKFGQFPHLKYLDLSSTTFTGKVPMEIARLSRLISFHIFSSHRLEMPDLGLITENMTDLKELVLENLLFNSVVPRSFVNLSSLTSLKLTGSGLRGNFPTDILHLPHLQNLHIEGSDLHANFSGFSWTSPLEELSLSSPHFTGKLPEPAGPTQFLRKLQLQNSNFYGVIPSWVWNVTEEIDLSSNQLSGQLVIEHVNISRSLQLLDLRRNMIHGSIPTSIFGFKSLSKIYLQSNKLNGTIDFSMFHKLKSLSILWLSNNNLSLSLNNIETSTVWPQFIELGLSSCNLGKFPEFLICQESLQVLELSNNRIHGQLPQWLREKNTLSLLNISYNYLTGGLEHVPWNDLEFIDLRSNMFRGPLPQLPPFIQGYLVSNNKFTGKIPLTICNLTTLLILDFSNNSLTGQIPRCLGNLSDELLVLNLKLNKFDGTLPQDFTKSCSLENLDVNENQLEGPVPTSLSNCSSLRVLNLENNKFSGKFPPWLGTLSDLEVLVLRSNRFKGCQTELDYGPAPFPKLRKLDISNNKFSGNLPSKLIKSLKAMMNKDKQREVNYMSDELSYFVDFNYMYSITLTFKGSERELDKVPSVLTTIDVSANKFEGDIPNEIADLVSLRWLNLSYNHFSGTIPPSLGNLSMLESLDFSSNELFGHIPKELTSLTSLEFFNASRNHLFGLIPVGNQFNTFGNGSYLGNPGLCGTPLVKKCNNDDDDDDDDDEMEPQSPKYDDSEDIGYWEIVLMGYGSGIVIGLSIGYFVFWVRTPLWLSRLIYLVEFIIEQCSKRQKRI